MFISTAGGKRRFDLLASMALSRRAEVRGVGSIFTNNGGSCAERA